MTDPMVVWLMPPFRQGEPKVFEAKPDVLVPAYSASLIIPIRATVSRSAGAGT